MNGGPEQPAEVAANHYYDPNAQAGEEISSTGEGRHVYVQEVTLIHADPGDGLVDKGQPVSFWDGVGIALVSAKATSDNIPIDTEGIWRLSVVATAQIYIGQVLYITGLGVVTDVADDAWGVMGYAMQGIAAAGTEIIAVKVHWMGVPWNVFWWDWWPQYKT